MERMTLKQFRLVREMSRDEMGERIGVHANTIGNWENNPKSVNVGDLLKIMDLFNIKFDDIFFE